MPSRAIALSTLWQIASQAMMAVLSIITVKLVILGLDKQLVGNYNSAYGFLQLFGILADSGLYAVAVREVSRAKEEDRERVLGSLLVVRMIAIVLSLGIALLIAWSIPGWKGTPLPLGITIAAFVPFFTLLSGVIRTVFQVRYAMHYVFIAEVTQRILTTLLIALPVMWGLRHTQSLEVYHYFLLAGGIGAFVLFSISFIFARRFIRIRPVIDPSLLKRFLLESAPYALAYVATALYRQFDVTLIALLRPDYALQNAYYGPVVRIGDLAFLLPTLLLNSVLPTLNERDQKGEDTRSLLGKTLFALLLLGSLIALPAAFWSRSLAHLLTATDYLSAGGRPGSDTALALLSIPMFLNGLVLFGFYILLTRHAWKPLVSSLFLGALASLALNLLLIPRFGFVGACITSIIVHLLLTSLLLPLGLKAMPAHLPKGAFLRWIAFSLLLAGTLALLSPLMTSALYTLFGIGIVAVVMGLVAWMGGMGRYVR